jgi:hypothetical protein
MTVSTPNPLRPGNIPGQNPNTPERMPGHTAYFSRDGGWRGHAPWLIVCLLVLFGVLYAVGVIGH